MRLGFPCLPIWSLSMQRLKWNHNTTCSSVWVSYIKGRLQIKDFRNRALRRIFGPKEDEEAGGLRILLYKDTIKYCWNGQIKGDEINGTRVGCYCCSCRYGHIVPPPPQLIHDCGAPTEWYWRRKTEELGEKLVPVPLFPPQISHGVTCVCTVFWSGNVKWKDHLEDLGQIVI
jgi:hypothetical protein